MSFYFFTKVVMSGFVSSVCHFVNDQNTRKSKSCIHFMANKSYDIFSREGGFAKAFYVQLSV